MVHGHWDRWSGKLYRLPVGEVQTNGTIKAYTYTVEEISPPDFYQISGESRNSNLMGKGTEMKNFIPVKLRMTQQIFTSRKQTLTPAWRWKERRLLSIRQ